MDREMAKRIVELVEGALELRLTTSDGSNQCARELEEFGADALLAVEVVVEKKVFPREDSSGENYPGLLSTWISCCRLCEREELDWGSDILRNLPEAGVLTFLQGIYFHWGFTPLAVRRKLGIEGYVPPSLQHAIRRLALSGSSQVQKLARLALTSLEKDLSRLPQKLSRVA